MTTGNFQQLLQPKLREFIEQHERDDEYQLLLSRKEVEGVPIRLVVDQIVSRRKAKLKLPTFYHTTDVLFPPALNVEQTSSETTARFKASWLQKYYQDQPAGRGLDLTGGFGVDSFFLSQVCAQLDYVEPDERLNVLAQHNHPILGAHNIQHHTTTAEEFVRIINHFYDFVFIDPSRRSADKKKVVSFHDCEPNVVELQERISTTSKLLLIKASPMLDINLALAQLHHVREVIVLSVANECKELLFLVSQGNDTKPTIYAINIEGEKEFQLKFYQREEQAHIAPLSEPQQYIYEPNASILKAGAFKIMTQKFPVTKLHTNTHLYTSPNVVENFPGRAFKIIAEVRSDKKEVNQFFPEHQANVITRNYPLKPEALKQKLKLQDGGSRYLIATTSIKGKHLFVTERL